MAYREHGNWLLAFLRRRFGQQEAEDLAQETYVQTVGAKTEIHNPRAFLARVALRTAREISERKANRMVFWPGDAVDFALAPEQENALLLKQAVLNLPSELQVVFVLSRFAGLTNQICVAIGENPGKVLWAATVAGDYPSMLALLSAELHLQQTLVISGALGLPNTATTRLVSPGSQSRDADVRHAAG